MRPLSLHPSDVAVALELAVHSGARPDLETLGYRELAIRIQMSHGEAHNAVKRLRAARLVRPDTFRIAASSLLEFLLHGVRYAFPAELGAATRGVLTGPSAPIVALSFTSDTEPVVWPSANGDARGASLSPLVASAPELPAWNPVLYESLALVDALRIGRARERRIAGEILTKRITRNAAELSDA